nr:reverse transcriptase domain-containing protein [Tanacetum cinerariifolium]
MVPATTSLTGFSGETTWPLGQLKLLVTIGDATHSTKAWMNFMFVKSLSPYNGIIGRLGLKAIQAVPSTVHGMLKFPTEEGIVTIRSSLLIPAECASVDTSSVTPGEKKARPANLTVPLHPNFPDQEVVVGGSLSDKGRIELCSLLKKNLDIFAWKPSDMTGVPRSIAEYRLNVQEGCPPVRQKKKRQAPERIKAIQAEVEKLVEARIIREVYYHDWLSNPVMNDWKVESLCGYPFKCFLDAYKGYHQIQMAAADEEKQLSTQDRGCTAILRCLLASKMLVPPGLGLIRLIGFWPNTYQLQVSKSSRDIRYLKFEHPNQDKNSVFISGCYLRVYLVFKFGGPSKTSSRPMYVNLTYKMGNETLHSYFATSRDEWMMIELSRFLNHKEEACFEVLLESFSRCYCGTGDIYVEAAPAVRNVKGTEHHTISAKEAIYDSSNVKHFTSKPSAAESRLFYLPELHYVVSIRTSNIKCKIESQTLSTDAEYACYLVFKLSETCCGLHCPVIVRDLLDWKNKRSGLLYIRSPSALNRHDIDQVPEKRKDGLME